MWRQDGLGFLRSFIDKIQNDQVHFLPPSVASRQCAPEAHISDQWAHDHLSKNFVQGVYSQAIFCSMIVTRSIFLLLLLQTCELYPNRPGVPYKGYLSL
jgi:hypothetical protein